MKPLPILALALAAAHGAAVADALDTMQQPLNVHGPIELHPPAIAVGDWFTSAELGAITTSGNTSGVSISGKIDARHETPNWSNEYTATGFFKQDQVSAQDGSQHSQRSAQRFMVSAKAAYKLLGEGERAFVLGSHVSDRFGAYTRYSSLAIGRGSRWFKSDDATLDVEIGPGYFRGDRATGETEEGVTVRGAGQLHWHLSPSAAFAQSVSVERGTSNTRSIAETSLSTKINDTMQMKAGFSARSDSQVPDGKKNTDTETSLTMVYSF